MFNRFIRYQLIAAVLVFATACSSIQAGAPAANGALSATSSLSPTSVSSSKAWTLKDFDSTKVYTFNIVPDQTQASYSVKEVLLGQSVTTVGTTNVVQGQFQLGIKDGKPYIVLSQLRVDLRTLTSDNPLRDQAIRRQWLESNTYPYADFVAKEVTDFPSSMVEGQTLRFKVIGDMTIRNITRSVTFDVTAKIEGDTLTGTGTTLIYMKDFGFSAPDLVGRFTVTDGVTITVQGAARLDQSQF